MQVLPPATPASQAELEDARDLKRSMPGGDPRASSAIPACQECAWSQTKGFSFTTFDLVGFPIFPCNQQNIDLASAGGLSQGDWSGSPSCGDGEPLGRSAACWLRRASVEDQSAEPGPAPPQLPPADLAIGHACSSGAGTAARACRGPGMTGATPLNLQQEHCQVPVKMVQYSASVQRRCRFSLFVKPGVAQATVGNESYAERFVGNRRLTAHSSTIQATIPCSLFYSPRRIKKVSQV